MEKNNDEMGMTPDTEEGNGKEELLELGEKIYDTLRSMDDTLRSMDDTLQLMERAIEHLDGIVSLR